MNSFQRILPVAHHHHAARHFAFTVQLRHSATDFRPVAHRRDIAEQHRFAVTRREHHIAEIVQRAQITGGAHHVFRLPHLQQRAAALLIRRLNGTHQLTVSDIQRTHFFGRRHYLILTHHAADAGDFRDVRHGFKLKL
ncbi:hypothetical protein D3C72_963620 [compost metagenome]